MFDTPVTIIPLKLSNIGPRQWETTRELKVLLVGGWILMLQCQVETLRAKNHHN